MKYNFDKIADRRNTNQVKWDVKDNELPMWVADMDFEVLPEIKEALTKGVNVGAYGYAISTDKYFEAYISWWKRNHEVSFKKEWMAFSSSVIASIDVIINTLTPIHSNIVLLSPVYNAFFNCVRNYDRNVVESFLIRKDNDFYIDYTDLENKLSDKNTSMLIFCNPHNPIGKIWSKEDILKVSELCKKHNVIFLSDEIHCDIVDPGKKYVPALSVTDDAIVCISGSKVFNMAGLRSSCVVIPNKEVHDKIQKALWKYDVGEPNCLVVDANIAAFTYGDEWVKELNEYLYKNKQEVASFIKNNIPQLTLVNEEATYLLWIDISRFSNNSSEFASKLREKTGLFVSSGDIYGTPGNSYIRMNIATSLANVKDGLNRLKAYIDTLN